MNLGVAILGVFGAVWCGWGLWLWRGGPDVWLALPVAAALAFLAGARAARRAPVDPQFHKRLTRLFRIASIIEVAAIWVAVYLLGRNGRADLAPHAIAMIVGLHFIPVAWMAPLPRYFLVAGAMVMVATGALILPASVQTIAVCIGSAAVLWTTAASLLIVPTERRA